MATGVREVDEIRQQMAQIRLDMHQDVRAVVAGAEAVTDWRRYIRAYPWITLGVAFVAGYLIVPRKRRSIRATAEAAATSAAAKVHESVVAPLQAEARANAAEKKKKSGLIGTALAFLGPVALRAVQSALVSHVESLVAAQTAGNAGPSRVDRPGGTSQQWTSRSQ